MAFAAAVACKETSMVVFSAYSTDKRLAAAHHMHRSICPRMMNNAGLTAALPLVAFAKAFAMACRGVKLASVIAPPAVNPRF